MMFITDLTPDAVDSLVVSIISDVYAKSAGVVSLAAVATLWSAAKGMLAMSRGLNEINDVDEDRNYVVVRGSSVLLYDIVPCSDFAVAGVDGVRKRIGKRDYQVYPADGKNL